MNTEKYLEQIAVLDKRIRNKTRDINRWKESAEYSPNDYGTERVQSSGNQKRMENSIIRSLCLEEQRERDIQKRKKIISDLDKLSEKNPDAYDVLYQIYVIGKSYKEIAIGSNKSMSWVRYMRKIGIEDFDKILRSSNE